MGRTPPPCLHFLSGITRQDGRVLVSKYHTHCIALSGCVKYRPLGGGGGPERPASLQLRPVAPKARERLYPHTQAAPARASASRYNTPPATPPCQPPTQASPYRYIYIYILIRVRYGRNLPVGENECGNDGIPRAVRHRRGIPSLPQHSSTIPSTQRFKTVPNP